MTLLTLALLALGSAAHAAPGTAFPNDKTAYDYFRSQGFTNFQAAGIVGNLDQESGLDPTISQQNGGPGRGIAQWSAGGRWDSDPGDNVLAFAKQQNKSPYALDLQLDFIMFELNTIDYYGLAKLRASTTIEAATTDFELDFEGCGIPAQCDADSRLNYAKSIFAAYGDDPVMTDGGSSGDAGAVEPPDLAGPSPPADMAAGHGGSGGSGGSGGTGGSSAQPGHAGGCALAMGAASSGAATWMVAFAALLLASRRRRVTRDFRCRR
jgi:hypothetical protein